MIQHRILRSEADEPRPLAYLQMYRPSRRARGGYMAAAMIGGAAALIGLIVLAALSGAFSG